MFKRHFHENTPDISIDSMQTSAVLILYSQTKKNILFVDCLITTRFAFSYCVQHVVHADAASGCVRQCVF